MAKDKKNKKTSVVLTQGTRVTEWFDEDKTDVNHYAMALSHRPNKTRKYAVLTLGKYAEL